MTCVIVKTPFREETGVRDGRQNITLPALDRFIRVGLVVRSREQAEVERMLDLVQVVRRALWSPARNFSGGNQQKIVIAKWLLAGSRVLLLYDPTRGVDVGTKAEIYRLIRAFADAGWAITCTSCALLTYHLPHTSGK